MIRFIDAADAVTHGSDASIDDLSPFSFVCWLRPDTLAASTLGQIFYKQTGATGRGAYRFSAVASGAVGLYVSRASGYDERITTEFMSDGVAYFLCFSWSTTNKVRIYYGTTSAAVIEATYDVTDQTGTGAASSDAAQTLYIGNTSGLSDPVTGDIGRVGYFAAELSLANFESLRTSAPSAWEGLFASCELASDYTDTSTISDVTSNSNDGTNSGGSTASDPSYPVLQYILAWLRA